MASQANIETILSHLATKADVKRQTTILVAWLVASQIALFLALTALISHFLG